MDFIGPLPLNQGHNCILTITDHLNSDVCIIPRSLAMSTTKLIAKDLASLFFNHWYCKNSLPSVIISDCNKLFMSSFWKHLTLLSGIKCKASTSFHLQSNSASECTNKTINQCLLNVIKKAGSMPFLASGSNIMSTTNRSTGYTLSPSFWMHTTPYISSPQPLTGPH